MIRPTMGARIAMIFVMAMITVAANRSLAVDAYEYFARKLPQPETVFDFTLTGPDGKPYSLTGLRGKFVLIVFGFTHCPNVCPTTLANLAAAYERLSPNEQTRVQVLFVTIDPQRDTAAVLKDYVTFFDPHFLGLTGPPDKIATVAKACDIEYEKTRDWGDSTANYTMDHTSGVLLLSPSGQWVGAYGVNQLIQSERVAADLRHFLAQTHLSADSWLSLKGGVVKPRSCRGENYI